NRTDFTLVRLETAASIPGATMSLSPPGRSSAYSAITAVVLVLQPYLFFSIGNMPVEQLEMIRFLSLLIIR
ncbi:hypothetical protein, partial [Xenorhabdus vietnamensis]|uniref:hypothetical protein n=1 Tax=Xenorhabdus vietnamensis TaxID=351656 RepID=UPI001ABFD281